MANRRYECKCGGIIVYALGTKPPTLCAWCKTATGLSLNVKRLRSPYSGYTVQQVTAQSKGFLGAGVNRTVFALGDDLVVKVDQRGKANHKELNVWQSATPEIKKWLCPIVDWAEDLSWIIMRRVNGVGGWSVVEKIPNTIRRSIGDVHPANVGLLNGRAVIIDYVGGAV